MRFLSIAVVVLVAGCVGGGRAYPDTDVVEVPGFALKSATGVQKSGGLFQSGTLEYQGGGDLHECFREYVAKMRERGWTSANDEIGAQKATGVLRKDNRTCSLQFVASSQTITATIKVDPTK